LLPFVLLTTVGCRVLPDDYVWPQFDDHSPYAVGSAEVGTPSDDGNGWSQDTSEIDPAAARVIVLVIDGARIDESFGDGFSTVTNEATSVFLPNIRTHLLPVGTLVRTAFNTGVTITAEGHTSILTGARLPVANLPTDDGAGNFRPDRPTLFELLRDQEPVSAEQVMVGGNTVHLQGLTHSLHPGWGRSVGGAYELVENPDEPLQPAGDDVSVINAVQQRMDALDTRLIVANLHQMDRAGHYNTRLEAYAEHVKEVDGPIVEFWNWIQADTRYQDTTTLIVLADHGRHRRGTESDHRHHGDSCAGCRQIPMLLIGPRIRQGLVSHTPATLEDIGATIGYLLGLMHPHVEGRVLTELIVDSGDDRAYPEGSGQIAAVGSHQAARMWLDEPLHRSAVTIDGAIVSGTEAFHAEAPSVASDGVTSVVCWREFHFDPTAPDDSLEDWPWLPQCRIQAGGSDWASTAFPAETVSPYFSPALALGEAGDIWAGFADNPTGNWEALNQVVRLWRWTATQGWSEAGPGANMVRFPLHVSVLPQAAGALVAFVTSDTLDEDAGTGEVTAAQVHGRARYRRHIVIERVNWPDAAAATWHREFRSYTADHYTVGAVLPAPPTAWNGWSDIGRVDRPTLYRSEGRVHMTFLAFDAVRGDVSLMRVQSDDDGTTWHNPVVVDASGMVIPSVTPQWTGTDLIWARATEDGATVCRATSGASPECMDTLGQAIDSISHGTAGAVAAIWVDGEWQVHELAW
jgi:hypothetical protein